MPFSGLTVGQLAVGQLASWTIGQLASWTVGFLEFGAWNFEF
jgi:hypothetical protein